MNESKIECHRSFSLKASMREPLGPTVLMLSAPRHHIQCSEAAFSTEAHRRTHTLSEFSQLPCFVEKQCGFP